MLNKKSESIRAQIEKMYKENAPYILASSQISHHLETIDEYEESGNASMVDCKAKWIMRDAKQYHESVLTPAVVNVGDGVTVHLWSDAHAATVIKKTKCSITVQYDTATLDPNFKPEFIAGGFAGHCINQEDQTYTYQRNSEGAVETYRWSNKFHRYQNSQSGLYVTKGRHEFYDYNF